MPHKLAATLATLTLTLTATACGNDGPDIDAMVNAWWTSPEMTTQTQAEVCLIVDEVGSGFNLIASVNDGDDVIDLLEGGVLPDTLENRRAVGEAIDGIVAGECG